MKAPDALLFVVRVLRRHVLRTVLLLLSVAVGVGSVVVLTSLGESARSYVMDEFKSLGTSLLSITPGRSETTGMGPSFVGATPRDLTIEDSEALGRSVAIRRIAPMVVSSSSVSRDGKNRPVRAYGATADFLELRSWKMGSGRFLPEGDVDRAPSVIVLGEKVRKDLFGPDPAIGSFVRLGDRRFRVIGILENEGRSLGADVDEIVVLPVARAMEVFDRSGLYRIMVEARSRDWLQRAEDDARRILKERHQGEEDVTIVRQDAVVKTFDTILRTLTWSVSGIASISLLVAGVLLMNVMLVSVSQRTAEIGLLKAIGASRQRILGLFLLESGGLALFGALVGLLVGFAGNAGISHFVEEVTLRPPAWTLVLTPLLAVAAGVLFGFIPARRAADLDAIDALMGR